MKREQNTENKTTEDPEKEEEKQAGA